MFTGPTAHLPPLYPALLAVLHLLTGELPVEYFFASVDLLNAAAYAGLVVASVSLARRLGGLLEARIVAGLLVSLPLVQVVPGWESTVVAAAMAVYCCYCLSPKPRASVLGLLGAITALLNVPAALFVVVWSAGLIILRRERITFVLRAGLLAGLLCSPWMVRNLLVLGTFCIRDNSGLEIQVSNNEYAQAAFADNFDPSFTRLHPNISRTEAEQVKSLGEAEYNRRKWALARAWMEKHPTRFLQLSFWRMWRFWFPDRRDQVFAPAIWLVTLLSIPAMFASFRQCDEKTILTAALLAYSLPFCFVQSMLRYRTPVVWVTVVFAASTLVRVRLWRWPAFASLHESQMPACKLPFDGRAGEV